MSEQAGIVGEPTARRIGRHEILGHLAAGGMAEILLARVVGPHGFERPVVIKRILPHLATQPGFVEMFTDEARIAASIRHANVVQVYELGSDAGELYLVMEYLEGESLAGLQRRLVATRGSLEPALAAWIVAEACAGLHAAHELESAEGRPLGVVHRDVSPQNLFVGYDGTVKVLDFGIAKAADRLTATETGALKGKIGYMSPEQCSHAALDRRSDVFALGTVLAELVSGRRLFRRATQVLSIRAIVDDPIPDPLALHPSFPEPLAAIVRRALSRDRDARQASAAVMRAELLAAIATLDPSAGTDALATRMQTTFATRIAEKKDMLRRLRSGSSVSRLPAADADLAVELPGLDADTQVEGPTRRDGARDRARSPLVWLVLATSTLAIALVVASWATASSPSTATAPLPTTPATTASVAPTGHAPSPPSLPTDVQLDVASSPDGARVMIDGEARGETPTRITLPRDEVMHELRLEREGFEPHVEPVLALRDVALRVQLEPRPVTRRRPRGEPAAPPAAATSGFRKFE
ncbi:MAG: serine/threonine protein kinase [Deltaproteobacteria bacterium]|nr:serine/threonine protein kinase [Deltaproteobacteria bacterium]